MNSEPTDGIPYRDLPLETDWHMRSDRINRLQQASMEGLVRRCKQAHHVDVIVRINGRYEVFEADWIKHLEKV